MEPDGHAASGASADASAEASPRGGLPSGKMAVTNTIGITLLPSCNLAILHSCYATSSACAATGSTLIPGPIEDARVTLRM